MTLSIEHVLNITDEQADFAGFVDLSEMKRHGEVLFPEQLAVCGTVANRAGVVTLRYQISGRLPYACDRCLMQCERTLVETFSHSVVRQLADEELDDVFLVSSDGVLQLDEIASADLLLFLPQVFLCREDCKGLCPRCGGDLNVSECDCRRENVDLRFAKLKELL
ncbi:MAG: DUF177 domain-containing protein [Oscillospiraceae bacterium]